MPSSPRLPKALIWALAVLSFSGVVDAAYLTVEHILNKTPHCVVFSGCDVVAMSSYSAIGPVPVAALGLAFYILVFFLTVLYADRSVALAIRAITYASLPAFLFTLYLVYVQLFVLHALCIYCMFSALISTCISVISLYAFARLRAKDANDTKDAPLSA